MSFGFVAAGIGVASSLFGTESETDTVSSGTSEELEDIEASKKTYLDIDDTALEDMVSDILGSEKGLADIFSEEKVAGLYNSTVSAQASGDLVAELAGEIAKLTAKEVEEVTSHRETTGLNAAEDETEKDNDGLLGVFGF